MRNALPWARLATLTTLAVTSSTARAETCPAPPDAPAVAAIDAQRRLDYLKTALDDELKYTDLWSWTLGTAIGVFAVSQAAAIPAFQNDRDTRIDLIVGSIGMGVNALALYLLPLQLTVPLRDMQHHWNDADRCEVIARAERTLVSVQKDEARATGVTPHIINIVANVAIAVGLTAGFGQYKNGPISGMIGTAIGEGNALTQPSNLTGVLARYKAGMGSEAPKSTVGWRVTPLVGPQAAGASFVVSW
jgi:hypothetical protein